MLEIGSRIQRNAYDDLVDKPLYKRKLALQVQSACVSHLHTGLCRSFARSLKHGSPNRYPAHMCTRHIVPVCGSCYTATAAVSRSSGDLRQRSRCHFCGPSKRLCRACCFTGEKPVSAPKTVACIFNYCQGYCVDSSVVYQIPTVHRYRTLRLRLRAF